MATIDIGKRPDVTVDSAVEAFQRHFAGKYEVYTTMLPMRDFVVKKSGSVGVSLRLKQDDDGTTFVYTGFTPSAIIRAVTGAIGYLIFRGGMTALEGEVAAFIQSEYKPAAA